MNYSNNMPMIAVPSRGRISDLLGVDVAASIQKNLRANIARIFKRLKERGVTQVTLAEDMGVTKSLLSQLKSGEYDPSIAQLEKLLAVLNRYEKIEPEDLFKDPSGQDTAVRDLLQELAKRAGYEIVKRKPN